jgi:hypothetical protein
LPPKCAITAPTHQPERRPEILQDALRGSLVLNSK